MDERDFLVETRDLTKKYGPRVVAADNVSLTVRRGEVYGLQNTCADGFRDHDTDAGPIRLNETTTDHERDVETIKRIIADVETGFNTKDPDLSVEHFARNALVVNVTGVRLSGWDALLDATRRVLAGPLRDQYARYGVGVASITSFSGDW